MSKLIYERDGDLGLITLNDSPLNMIDLEFMEELEGLLHNLADEKPRALLFKVEKGNFSAGANIEVFKDLNEEAARNMLKGFLNGISKIENLPFPTMAAVKGMCIGGGFELALACDYIWASENAQFAAAEVLIGIVPLGGGAQRLAQRAGIARAKEITLSGRFQKPEKLERWNIINRVLSKAQLNEKAIRFMKAQARGPTLAFDTIKILLSEYYDKGIDQSDELLIEIVPKLFETDDIKTGIESFKREGPGKAIFEGK